MERRWKTNGFTLVELSIVMIIIGLLIGGILKGQELVMNARVASVVTQTKQVSAAYNTFYDSYHAVPGDMSSAEGGLANCLATTACYGGNGDNVLGVGIPTGQEAEAWYNTPATITSENTQFWKHLALTDMIGGINPTATVTGWNQTHPYTSLDAGLHARTSRSVAAHGSLDGLTLVLRNDLNGNWKCDNPGRDNCAIAPDFAYRIDAKMDDGYAFSGIIQSISSNWGNGCGTANHELNGPDGYAHEVSTKSCDMMFKVAN